MFLVEPDKLDIKIKDTFMVFSLSCIISRVNGGKTAKQMKSMQTQFCSNFLTWLMRYNVNR